MDLGLQGKVAMIAAASSGLGRAAAMALAAEGSRVALCARREHIHEVAGEIERATGSRAVGVVADLTSAEAIEAFTHRTIREFGQVDILVINSGGPPPGGFFDLKDSDWEAAFQLTVMSAQRLCRCVVPHMLERKAGSIVASLSYSVKQPIDNLMLSNALRMAVIGMMKTLASELGPKGIRINTLNPGWTRTDRVEALLQDRARRRGTDQATETLAITHEIPLGRMATVEEYGRVVAWLASPAASYIHGQAVFFDGGITRASL